MSGTSKFDKGNSVSRRDFIRNTAIAAGAVSTLAASSSTWAKDTKAPTATKSGLNLNAAGYSYNRADALFTGDVTIKGCDTQFKEMGIGDINTHIFSGPQTLDFAEVGLHPFMLAYANENFRDYTLLPIFLLRLFRHKSIFIRNDRGINTPKDLIGKTIATPGYSSTSLTWIRGMLKDEYGIKPEDINWITSSKDSSAKLAGKVSAQEQMIPKGITMTMGSEGKDESDLLVSGEADALFHAAEPKAFTERHPQIARLFGESRATEQAYFKKTEIFPIMHAVAVKKGLLQKNPWLAEAIFNAYSQAKQRSYAEMQKASWFKDMLPWYGQELESTRDLMGENFYSYGIEGNQKTLNALFRYSHEQGLSSRKLTVEELFDPLSLTLAEA